MYVFLLCQVQLLGLNTVERVATRGGNAFWTTGFRLAYSVDCVNFNNLVDGNGNDIVSMLWTDPQQSVMIIYNSS